MLGAIITLAALAASASALAPNRLVLGAVAPGPTPWLETANVTIDERAVVINGQRQLIMAGSIHYPRSTPDMWPHLFQLARESGLNAVDTYVFWNEHEAERGVYDFDGRKDLRRFIQLAADYDLWVVLRIGPYVCAEWNYGGFPAWLRQVPDIHFRTLNAPFMREMARFVTHIVKYTEDLFLTNGGPIALLQIENEYGLVERDYGTDGHAYIEWAAAFAKNLESNLPWFVCVQDNVTGIVNTCNGFYCDSWMRETRAFPDQAGMWTENWSGWFSGWGDLKPTRPAEDLALGVALWFANGGTYNAYYMFHGGTNFARTAGGGPAITTTYDYDAPVGEFGFKTEPKFTHLQELHSILNTHSQLLLHGDKPSRVQVAAGVYLYTFGDFQNSSQSLIFLHNENTTDVVVTLDSGKVVALPRWSVSLLEGPLDNATVVYNTAKMSSAPSTLKYGNAVAADGGDVVYATTMSPEPIGIWNESLSVSSLKPQEQLSLTNDKTDYLWCVKEQLQVSGPVVELVLEDVNDFVVVFFDGELVGHSRGNSSVTFSFEISASMMNIPTHKLQILTQTLGLTNFGSFREQWSRGLLGRVLLNSEDITQSGWKHLAGLRGEQDVSSLTAMVSERNVHSTAPFLWHQVRFSPLKRDPAVAYALDLGSMGKGQAWVNGQHIGRYWNISAALPTAPTNPYPNPGEAVDANHSTLDGQIPSNEPCDYAGPYYQDKCRVGTVGEPTQRYYHVPAEWLVFGDGNDGEQSANDNSIVLFEELGGNVSGVELVTVQAVQQSDSSLTFQL